jgi:phosphopantothenoylcysteine synthetase/decarboxylase
MLKGKRTGVSGSIAAYKAATLVRLLVKQGAEIKVIMTLDAHDFITPLTLATLSKNPVLSTFTNNDAGTWNNHVELALWADMLLIAPATANTIAKMANGICDNLLLATYLSAKCTTYIAPAMDLDMYAHPATQYNLQRLRDFGNHVLPVADENLPVD